MSLVRKNKLGKFLEGNLIKKKPVYTKVELRRRVRLAVYELIHTIVEQISSCLEKAKKISEDFQHGLRELKQGRVI